MNLAEALRLVRNHSLVHDPPCLALVGAGGKSTALFQLGWQLPRPLILTATTHLAVHQLDQADHHLVVRSLSDLKALPDISPGMAVLVTGPEIDGGRVSGLDPTQMDWLDEFARECRCPLLIEADGSRQRPLKAPASHEPAIPTFVRQVVVVAGLSALEKPLLEEWVHRPEMFAALSGLGIGEVISPEALIQVLTSPEGGMKNIPAGARRVVLLTQVDTIERESAAKKIAGKLFPAFHSVVLASLGLSEKSTLESGDPTVFSVEESVGGVLLAAGGSSRMGEPKQLLEWRGEPLVRQVAHTALSAGLSPLVIVTGAFREEVSKAVADLPVTLIDNPDWGSGQSGSVKLGVSALPPETGAAIFLLVDQPQVPVSLLQGLVELHSKTLSPLVAPRVAGQRANPVLFDRQVFPDLMAVRGDTGGRGLFSQFPVAWLEWPDENLLLDIDTEEDYRRLRNIPLP